MEPIGADLLGSRVAHHPKTGRRAERSGYTPPRNIGNRALVTAFVTLGAAVLVGSGPISAASASPKAAAAALCGTGSPTTRGTIANPALTELSGLVRSRAQRDVLWAHNDSGDSARLFTVGLDGADRGVVNVTGVVAVDWEDIALGPGPDGRDDLFVGDIGDNEAARTEVTVYRIPEPAAPGPGATTAATGDRLILRYPDGPHDAEALLVDARNGDLVVITKVTNGRATVYRAPGATRAANGARVTLEAVGTLGEPSNPGLSQRLAQAAFGELANRVTAADANTKVGIATVRTYAGVTVFPWPARLSLADALLTSPCSAPAPTDLRFPQGEAIALAPNGRSYITAAEGASAALVEFRAR